MKNISILLLAFLITACASRPPATPSNICSTFTEKSSWYKDAKKSADKWQSNMYVPMAIMYQESAFKARAKPPMRYFLFIPYGRASNAYGYAQALESTWAEYQKEAGSMFSSRSDFADSMDFIQWYMNKTARVNRIPRQDAFRQYLNYHEGQGGYARGTYKNKAWLVKVARKVEQRAQRYAAQLEQCGAALERKRRWFF